MTPLDKLLKRSLGINGVDYVVTLSPDALKLTLKGRRLGLELKWEDIASGESALAVALHASVGKFEPVAHKKQAKPAISPRKTAVATSFARPPRRRAAPGARTRRR